MMLRADLQGPGGAMQGVKFLTRIAVIDSQRITALKFVRQIVDPIGRSEVYFGLVIRGLRRQFLQMIAQLLIGNWLIDECERVAVKRDKFFQPYTLCRGAKAPPPFRDDQVHRHGIEELVREMQSGKWIERID